LVGIEPDGGLLWPITIIAQNERPVALIWSISASFANKYPAVLLLAVGGWFVVQKPRTKPFGTLQYIRFRNRKLICRLRIYDLPGK
jgi:hypothetical protein